MHVSPGNSAGDLFGVVSENLTSNQGIKLGHELNHLDTAVTTKLDQFFETLENYALRIQMS